MPVGKAVIGGIRGAAAALVCIALLSLAAWAPAARAADRVYWTNGAANTIRVGNLDGSGAASTLFAGENAPFGLAIDPAANRIYWANVNAVRIGNLDGSGAASTLFAGENGPLGVAIDPAANRIYWVNQVASTIRAANLDGSGAASTLYAEAGGSQPTGVAIDPAANRIYWTSFGTNTIRVGNLDGTGTAATLFAGEGLPRGVAIDPAANRIYWGGVGNSTIRVGNLDGSGAASTLFTEAGGSGPGFPALLRAPAAASPPVVSRATRGAAAAAAKRKRFKPGTLSCSTGSWAPNLLGSFLYRAPRSFSYQWLRAGSEIPGATQSTYKPKKRGFYSCRVTATNHAGSATQTSERRCAKRAKPTGKRSKRRKRCRTR